MSIAFSPSEYTPFMQTAMVNVGNGVELCVETGGDPKNPAVLLIMGLGCQMLYWRDDFVQKLIAQGFYVIRYDNRDIGLSTKFKIPKAPRANFYRLVRRSAVGVATKNEPLPYNLHDMAKDAANLIDILDLGKVHVIGASMGGMVAQILAAKYPEKLHSLGILFSSNMRPLLPPPYPKQLKSLLSKPKSFQEEDIVNHGVRMFKAIGSPQHFDEGWAANASRTFYQRSFYPLGYIQQLNAILATGSLVKYNKKTTTPTLVVHGGADRLLHPKHGKSIANAIAGANYVEITGMGHDFVPAFQDVMIKHFSEHFKHCVS